MHYLIDCAGVTTHRQLQKLIDDIASRKPSSLALLYCKTQEDKLKITKLVLYKLHTPTYKFYGLAYGQIDCRQELVHNWLCNVCAKTVQTSES